MIARLVLPRLLESLIRGGIARMAHLETVDKYQKKGPLHVPRESRNIFFMADDLERGRVRLLCKGRVAVVPLSLSRRGQTNLGNEAVVS